jgi:hypothetical protein
MLTKQYAMVGKIVQANEKGWVAHTTFDYDRPPRSYRNAMSRVNRVKWLEMYRVEEQGFKDRDVFAIVVPLQPPNIKILGTTTVCDYKRDSGDKQLIDEFLELYGPDFDITGGEPMETFIGLQIIQSDTSDQSRLLYSDQSRLLY